MAIQATDPGSEGPFKPRVLVTSKSAPHSVTDILLLDPSRTVPVSGPVSPRCGASHCAINKLARRVAQLRGGASYLRIDVGLRERALRLALRL